MPLQTPYGVVVGTVDHYDLVNPSGGQWPHYHIWVNTPGGLYDSAINLKSLTEVKIEYRARDLDPMEFGNVLSLPNGWTTLGQNSNSGALDYVRRPGLTGYSSWILQTGDNLITELQSLLTNAQRIYIFGAAYSSGLGVHDVHMNQGDPLDSSFSPLDAIWQDGGLIFQYAQAPYYKVLQIKFETQSLHTDDQGHPVPLILRIPPLYYLPRWKWPPGDPLRDKDRVILVESGLFEMLQWTRAIPHLKGDAQAALKVELHRQLAQRLPRANAEYLDLAANYIVKLSVRTAGQQ